MTAGKLLAKPWSQAVRQRNWLLSWLSAALLGVFIGFMLVRFPTYVYLALLAGTGTVLAWWVFRRPHLTVMLFWVSFATQATLFAGFILQGLYYPIYLLMLLSLLYGLIHNRYRLPWMPLALYGAFMGLVLVSLFGLVGAVDFALFQRIFVYSLGLLTFFQFRSLASCHHLPKAQVLAALVVAVWVVVSAYQGGFAGSRVGIETDQNMVSSIVALGLIPVFARLLTLQKGSPVFFRLGCWSLLALGFYATLLLASRGQSIALALGLFAMLARTSFRLRQGFSTLVLCGIAALVLINLPGGRNLTERFTASDISTANGRVLVWDATVGAVFDASSAELLLGHGFDSSKRLVERVAPALTSTHNSYLQILFEYGLVGLMFFLALHFLVFGMLWQSKGAVALYGLGALTFLMMSNLSITATDSFLYWITFGHVLAIGVWSGNGDSRTGRSSLDTSETTGVMVPWRA